MTETNERLNNAIESGTLLACPFCGSSFAPEAMDAVTAFTQLTPSDEEYRFDGFAVVCNFNNGGCGSMGGNSESLGGAIEKWNKRAG